MELKKQWREDVEVHQGQYNFNSLSFFNDFYIGWIANKKRKQNKERTSLVSMKINYKKEFVKNKQGYLKYLDLNKVKQES